VNAILRFTVVAALLSSSILPAAAKKKATAEKKPSKVDIEAATRLQIFLDQQTKFRSQLNNILGQTPWSMLNDMTERNLDLWKSVQEGFLNAAANSGRLNPGKDKP